MRKYNGNNCENRNSCKYRGVCSDLLRYAWKMQINTDIKACERNFEYKTAECELKKLSV